MKSKSKPPIKTATNNNNDNTSQKNTNNNNSNNQQKPLLPQANLTSRVSEIFELINTEKHNN